MSRNYNIINFVYLNLFSVFSSQSHISKHVNQHIKITIITDISFKSKYRAKLQKLVASFLEPIRYLFILCKYRIIKVVVLKFYFNSQFIRVILKLYCNKVSCYLQLFLVTSNYKLLYLTNALLELYKKIKRIFWKCTDNLRSLMLFVIQSKTDSQWPLLVACYQIFKWNTCSSQKQHVATDVS